MIKKDEVIKCMKRKERFSFEIPSQTKPQIKEVLSRHSLKKNNSV